MQRRGGHAGVESLTEQILVEPAELSTVPDRALEAARQGAFEDVLFVVIGVDGIDRGLCVSGLDAARLELPGDPPGSAPFYHDGGSRVRRGGTSVIERVLSPQALESALDDVGWEVPPQQPVAELRRG